MLYNLPDSQMEVVTALYRYLAMSAEQLSVLLNFNLRTVYNMISRLRKHGWVRDVGLGFLGQNHRAYMLTLEGARRTALLTHQSFQPRIWKHRTMCSERTFYTNEFVTQLLVWSSEEDDEGLIEWMGSTEAAQSHAIFDEETGKRKVRLKPGTVGTYACCGGERIVFHLEVDMESTAIWRMQDQLLDYGWVLHRLWGKDRVQRVHVLVIAANAGRMQRFISLWQHLAEGMLLGTPLPKVWFMTREQFQMCGPLHGNWTNSKGDNVTWCSLTRLPSLSDKTEMFFIGKRNRSSPFFRR